MAVVAFKHKSSELRRSIKYFKRNTDKHELLRKRLPLLLMAIRLSEDPRDQAWRAEGLHQAALFYLRDENWAKAETYFIESLSLAEPHEILCMCRTLRDYSLLYARCGELALALTIARSSLQLHDKDIALFADDPLGKEKGERQKRITESFIWSLKLDSQMSDVETLDKLVEFALHECTDCCIRDQQQIVNLALSHSPASDRQKLRIRLGLLHAKRHEPVAFATNLVRFSIDVPLFIGGHVMRRVFRRE